MRSERRKCRSFWVNGVSSVPGSASAGVVTLFVADLVEADGGFKHQQHVKPVFADILHHAGNLLALNHRLMNRLAQLLNQFAHTGCHGLPPGAAASASGWRGLQRRIPLPYFRRRREQLRKLQQVLKNQPATGCYHHKRDETTLHWPHPGIGLRVAGRIAGQRAVAGAQDAAAPGGAAPGPAPTRQPKAAPRHKMPRPQAVWPE